MKLKVFLGLIAVMIFAFGTADAQDYSLTLDHVDGHYDGDPTTLETDVPITFHFRFTNPDSPNEARIIGAANGFRLYSPEGATWQVPTHLPYFSMDEFKWYVVYEGWDGPLLNFNDNLFVNTYSLTGDGADTIGFAGTAKQLIPTQPPGVQPGFSEIVYQINTQIGDNEHGKTLCVDSCYYPPANEWLWSSDTGSLGDILPEWNGPFCFRIVDPDAPVAGNLVVAPASITDSAIFPNSTVRSLDLTSSNASALNFSIADDADWLTVSPTGGSTPASVDVTLNGAVATVGTHNTTITITSLTAPNSPVTVPVEFKVKGPVPVIDCPTEAIAVTQCAPQEEICHPLAITGAETVTIIPPGPYWSPDDGGQFCFTPTVGGAQTYRVTASNASGMTQCDITFSVTIGSLPTVTCPPEPVALAVDELGGSTCIDLPVTNADQVALQSFGGVTGATWEAGQLCFTVSDIGTGKIIITATNGCGEANCFVDFNITINKYLEAAPDNLSFTAVVGSPPPASQPVMVSETNGANITFNLSADQGWVTFDPASGATPSLSSIGIDHSGLTAGDYSAELSITSGDAANSPLIVPITLTVTDIPTARLQVVHNAADPAAALVDVWVNGAKFIPDFAFRTATPFVDVPSGVELVIQVAPAPSTSPDEAVATIAIPAPGLTEDVSYLAVANGVIEPAGFEPNPDGADIDFTLFTKANVKEGVPMFTDFFILHGATDAQSVQLWMRNDPMPFVDSMAYGDMNDYIPFPPQPFILDVYDTGDTGFILATYDMDLSDLNGRTGVIFFSGFVNPENNQDGPAIGLFAALADGTVIEFPEIIPKYIEAIPDTLHYSATEGMPLGDLQTFDVVETGGAEIPVTVAVDFGVDWIFVDPGQGTTPLTITAGPNTTDLTPGEYYAAVRVASDAADNEDSVIIAFTVNELVISDVDSLIVGTGGAPPGAMSVPVPVSMVTVCDLYELQARFMWDSPYLTFDSVSLVGSAVGTWDATVITTSTDAEIAALAGPDNDPVPAGTNLLMTFYFTVDPATPEGFYPVDIEMSPRPFYVVGCPDAAMTYILPTAVPGGLVVKPEPNSVCGYVVDPDGISIEGATVELWANFPADGLEMTTFSDETGLFEFEDFQSMPYDLWGYKEGYYPALVEDINYTGDGIMIVLTPVDPVYETNEWVNFYCDENLYLGELMPVGSVVDAYDPDGTHCGTFPVAELGKYSFMPVYRDDPYEPGDQGAEPGDNIQFYINGLLAVATGETEWTQHLDSWEVCLDAGRTVTHTCELASGWNLVSWPVDHPSDYILDALASIQNDILLVAGFEKGGLTYDPGLPEFSTLWYVDHLSGYWILTNTATTLEIEGTVVPTNTPIPVTNGWNLVSYLAEETLPTEQALASIHDDLVVAQGYDGGALTYQPDQGGFNTLVEMGPCFGYWVKCMADGELVYPGVVAPAVAPKVNHDRIAAKGVPADLNTTTRWVNLYSGNMTLNGATVSARSIVTAHNAEGVKVGSFTMEKDGHFGFMPVYGDDPSTPGAQGLASGEEFYLAVDGVETNERFVWTSTGDRIEVFGLTAKGGTTENLPQSYSLSQNYPNPFNPTTTMSFNLPAAGIAKIEIFNVLGKLVAVPFDGMAQSGTTEVVWNGRNRAGEIVSSGIYFYRLTADNYNETKKMTLLK